MPELEDILRQGDAWYATLNQTTHWRTRDGRLMRVDEMTQSHCGNLVRWLVDRAEAIEFWYGLGSANAADHYAASFGEPDDFDIPVHDDEHPQDVNLSTAAGRAAWRSWCTDWIRSTPLVRRLVERAGPLDAPQIRPTGAPIRPLAVSRIGAS